MKEFTKIWNALQILLEATAVKDTFLGSDSTTGKKKTYMFLRAVRKFFCVALIGMAQRTSYL